MSKKKVKFSEQKQMLETAVKQLDNASGELYNAIENVMNVMQVSKSLKEKLGDKAEVLGISVSNVDSFKHELDTLISAVNEKRKQKKIS